MGSTSRGVFANLQEHPEEMPSPFRLGCSSSKLMIREVKLPNPSTHPALLPVTRKGSLSLASPAYLCIWKQDSLYHSPSQLEEPVSLLLLLL